MRLTRITETVDCRVFRDLIYHYQVQELAESDLRKLDEHADACGECSGYLEVETSFLRLLKNRLTKEEAPAGLEDRIRLALEIEAPTLRRGAMGWLRSHAFAAQAAAVLLVGFLFFLPLGEMPGPRGVSAILSARADPPAAIGLSCRRGPAPGGREE